MVDSGGQEPSFEVVPIADADLQGWHGRPSRPADARACSLLSLYDASSIALEKWPSAVSDSELKQRLSAILAADVAGYSRLMSLMSVRQSLRWTPRARCSACTSNQVGAG